MASPSAVIIVGSSIVLRAATYVFLRWIPGHHAPPIILASLIAYLLAIDWYLRAKPALIQPDKKANKGPPTQQPSDGAPVTRLRSQKNVQSLNGELQQDETKQHIPRDWDSQIVWTLMSGMPSPSSPFWTTITIFLNITAAILTADAIYRAPYLHPSQDLSFARVGYVSETTARILVREPDASHLPLYISYRGVASESTTKVDDSWKSAGQVYWLSNETDFTHTFTISSLRPSHHYQYASSNNLTGYFTTAPSPGTTHPSASKLTFLTSSCIKPRFPYSPFSHPLAIPGLSHLASILPSLHASFMLFLGDFIYIDVPRRLGFDPETYRREYRQVYASPSWPLVSSIPWLHVIDDHEIANDWDRNFTAPYPSAIDPWKIYHASVNPPPTSPGETWFTFTHGPVSFFLLDTRSYRSPSSALPAESSKKTMLGERQLSSLLSYLRAPPAEGVKWKFVITSIPFTRNWRFGSSDTWAGYLAERQTILEIMWHNSALHSVGIVVLSGDRHEFAATSFPPPPDSTYPQSVTVHEFSTSPLSMFYLPIRTYKEVEGEGEVCLKYVPDGNSKVGVIDVEAVGQGGQGVMRYRLFVDGAERWSYTLTSPERIGIGEQGREAIWG